jgi:hypothetical protein
MSREHGTPGDIPETRSALGVDETRNMAGIGPASTRSSEPLTVTALFDSAAGVDAALDALYNAGMPRDLIDVVVSPEAAAHFRGGFVRGPGRETFRFAGIGGLTGLLLGAAISLVMVAWPGLDAPGGQAIAQLLGPNVGLVAGAALGACAGFFLHRSPDKRHARAAEAAGVIVVAVATRSQAEGVLIARLLTERGGRDARLEDGP